MLTKTLVKQVSLVVALVVMFMAFSSSSAYATEHGDSASVEIASSVSVEDVSIIGYKAIASSICVGLAAAAGVIAMAWAIARASDAISRQPEAEGSIRGSTMLGMVFIETAIIYALIVAILIIFVL